MSGSEMVEGCKILQGGVKLQGGLGGVMLPDKVLVLVGVTIPW